MSKTNIFVCLQALLNRKSQDDTQKFTTTESKNVLLYIMGIMCYKFGLETYLGSISIIAADRFPKENAFTLLGALQGANQACQCLGSILIAPLMVRYSTNRVLAAAIGVFCLMACVLLITEASSGGTLSEAGEWNALGLFPIFLLSGVSHGMVELIRRIIPQIICGGNEFKLKKMDSLVHAFYEVAGTGGAFFSVYMLLEMGGVYANCFVPPVWVFSGLFWGMITLPTSEKHQKDQKPVDSLAHSILSIFRGFLISIYQGGKIIFSGRRFGWLVLGYSFPLVLHRYLESQLSPAFAKHVLKNTAYSQIMVGGSNCGELVGAIFVFLFTFSVPTPIPWVRLDSLTLNLLWILVYSYPTDLWGYAWLMALMCFFISSGWAAGDVSLSAFIQSSLTEIQHSKEVSPLGAVMAFLYTVYISVYASLSAGLGKVIDQYVKEKDPHGFLFWISGVMMTISSVLIFLSTFIAKGSFKLNPTMNDLAGETYKKNGNDYEAAIQQTATLKYNESKTQLAEKGPLSPTRTEEKGMLVECVVLNL